MTKVEDIFFSILRAALWGTDVQVPKGFTQWEHVMKLAKTQALLGLVAEVLLTRNEIRTTLPEKFVEKLQIISMTNVGMHSQMNMTLQLLVPALRKAGIEPVLLKGQGLAKYYPIPELRQCGDIDIYVGEENYEKAYEAMLPIVSEIQEKAEIGNWMHFDAKIGSVMVEVHQDADRMSGYRANKIYQEYILDAFLKELCPISFANVEVMTPGNTFNAFYIFHHLWRHFTMSGVGLRQFCDWACFLHTHVGKLELPYLKKMLDDLGFMKPWQTFGCFLVKDLGLPENEFPFYNEKYADKVGGVRRYVMKDGNFGRNVVAGKEKSRNYLHGKWVSLKFHIRRFFRMFAIFPKHTMLRLYFMLRDGIIQVFKDLKK